MALGSLLFVAIAGCARPARVEAPSPAERAPAAMARPAAPPSEAPPPSPAHEMAALRPERPPRAEVTPSAERPSTAREALEGFGSTTTGGAGERVIVITDPSEENVRKIFKEVGQTGHATLRFAVDAPIEITRPLPLFRAPHVTIEGGGATLDGTNMRAQVALIDVRTNDVIVRDLRVRNGYDNLRAQGPEAYNIVFSHVSSTGAIDDGISIGYGAHDVTVQYAFLAGNVHSIFCKYGATTNISVHHTWIQKAIIRSPLFNGPLRADVRNVIVEDWSEWGSRFEDGATGNVIGSLWTLSPYARAIGGKANSALRFRNAGPVYVADTVFRGTKPGDRGDATVPFPAPPVKTLPLSRMEEFVRSHAGCLPRDRIDQAYIDATSGWRMTGREPLRVH